MEDVCFSHPGSCPCVHAGRVEVSRAFGDKVFKKQGMTALPDIQAFQMTPRDAFLLCGCDGFWGTYSQTIPTLLTCY